MPLIKFTKLTKNETDLCNYSTRNSVNHQLARPQLKTTNQGLHYMRYKTAKYWNYVQNSFNLIKKFLKALKENIHSDNLTIK